MYLITGGGGKLGTYLCPLIKNIAPKKEEMNILMPEEIEKFVAGNNFKAIVHLAAITNQKLVEQQRMMTYQVNVIGTRNVAKIAKKYGLKVWFISSDYVFPCTKGNYAEADIPCPVNWYGYTKYAAELEIQNLLDNFGIIRTSFRPSVWGFPTAYTNVHTTADYTDVVAKEIALCLNFDLQGVIHIGTEPKTLYELAKRRNSNVQPEECNDDSFPKNRVLNISRWKEEKRRRQAL